MSNMTADDMFALLDASVPARRSRRMKIRVVPSEYGACPRCGAFWGNPNPALDFPNRQKVDTYWRCYNPECTCGYYDPETGDIEDKLSAEEEAVMAKRVHEEVLASMVGKHWETVDHGNGVIESRLVADQ